jgi:hypothetical protein
LGFDDDGHLWNLPRTGAFVFHNTSCYACACYTCILTRKSNEDDLDEEGKLKANNQQRNYIVVREEKRKAGNSNFLDYVQKLPEALKSFYAYF